MNIEQVWPEWQVDRLIGKGSYGAVYRCMKAGDKGKEYAAVKVISVPQDDFEADSVGSEGMTGEQSREYYKDITDTTSQTHSETKDVETRKVYYYYHYCDGNGNFAQSTQYA